MEPKDYSTLRSLLKQEQGEKIAPYIFKISDTKAVKQYLDKEGITYEIYQEERQEKKEKKKRGLRGLSHGGITMDAFRFAIPLRPNFYPRTSIQSFNQLANGSKMVIKAFECAKFSCVGEQMALPL
ncbi:hypothetical protein G9A89_017358 [Geosiphon pyriformis]|nr:hypothetical protein G9A89_017358 [Geosiphon pyriformis]